MKKILTIGMLLLALVMVFGPVSLSSCSNDDKEMEFVDTPGSKVYLFKYEDQYVKLKAIPLSGDRTPGASDDNGSETPGYYSKSYKTSLGDTIDKIKPRIAVIIEDETEVDEVVGQFGDKLSFSKQIGRALLYDCHVGNSDEVLEITTTLSKDERVIGCDAITNAKIVLC